MQWLPGFLSFVLPLLNTEMTALLSQKRSDGYKEVEHLQVDDGEILIVSIYG